MKLEVQHCCYANERPAVQCIANVDNLDNVILAASKDQPLWVNHTRVIHPEVPYCHAYRAVFRLIGMGAIGNASFVCDDRDWSKKTKK